jgi:hypothetical protein
MNTHMTATLYRVFFYRVSGQDLEQELEEKEAFFFLTDANDHFQDSVSLQ